MGTNFYFFTQEKDKQKQWFSYGEYELTDEPQFGYMTHLAKTSCGWLPLFQAHKQIRSVSDMKAIYDEGGFKIVDEYGQEYSWGEFKKRVLEFNGGVRGVMPLEEYDQSDLPEALIDYDMPNHIPVSHFEYANGRYSQEYFSDEAGYEFSEREFS